jgi:sugar phosphate isomerase/epimerase
MLRLSVSELSTYRWSFEDDVLHYRAAGFEAIGIWRAKLTDYGEDKAAELLREHGMAISSLHWIGGFTGSDGRSYRDSLHDGLDAIQLAADLRAECVVVLSGGRSGHTSNHAHRLLRAALKELAEAAAAVGVQLALEPMHVGCAFDWTFINTVPQCLDIIASINRDNLGIVFDCYHLGQDTDALHWLESIVPFVKLVQLGDAKHAPMGEQNRCLLGHGIVPLPEVLQAFQRGGYQGYYELEALGEELEHYSYEHVLEQAHRAAHEWSR